MEPSPSVTDDIFAAFLKCRYKAHLKLRGEVGEASDFVRIQAGLSGRYRDLAREALLKQATESVEKPPLLSDAIRSGTALITDATTVDAGLSCRIDALEKENGTAMTYRPVLFVHREKVTADDRMMLAFAASVLGRFQGQTPQRGRIVHGRGLQSRRVELASLAEPVADLVSQLRELAGAQKPPRLVLNRHCGECEFRKRCRAEATEKDDLSLLGGLSPTEIAALNGRGIFTVTQYSHTFRPGRMKKAAAKHDQSLQALAHRENTIYVAKRPELPAAEVEIYLDVEGLPDGAFYYLVGLTIRQGDSRRHLSFWADGEGEEASMWAAFLAAVESMGHFVLFHYGSYERDFLAAMKARHGGNAGLLARLDKGSVNVLSLIYSGVYFPSYGNDLKGVAGSLGFRWSSPDASGLQAIAWRLAWRDGRDEAVKQQLLAYNREDCEALEKVVSTLRSLGGDQQQTAEGGGPRVAPAEQGGGRFTRRFGTKEFALPEFAGLTKRAYFDYQRDKVICRTSPRVKKIPRPGKAARKKVWKVNQEIDCGGPAACSNCGSVKLHYKSSYRKLVIDLKPLRDGMRRWVTAYTARWHLCRGCGRLQTAGQYLAVASEKYGRGVCNWVAHSCISLRQTNEAVIQSLGDVFGIPLSSTTVSNLRQRVAERYRPTFEALLRSLRNGHLVHADETKAKMQGPAGNGYVWAFASPLTAVYVYSPTREGDVARQTLDGFKGVLVSDFYAAYDSLDCPQQKCLIHLIRDFNDDLLKHPFDEELKRQAARFTALLQGIVATVDRFGLKKYHLHKHKKDIDRFFDTEAAETYRSVTAGHYQHRLLKSRAKLFTFVDHDGVPWNNNNAENAVKQFASRRKGFGKPFTEAGIRDYLLLLSIYQTLRYRNASFWKFLQSGETDLDAFTARRR